MHGFTDCDRPPVLAVIGGGVVGQAYLRGFIEAGMTVCGVADIQPSPALSQLAAGLDIPLHQRPGPWLQQATHVLSAVFGSVSLAVARESLPHLSPGAIYVDMTTADPADMREADALATAAGQSFVDVSITGGVNLQGARTPLLCAGVRAEAVAGLFQQVGSPITVVGTTPGDAATLKLLRSIFTKGLEALTIECLATAEVRGLREQLFKVLADLDAMPLRTLMESLIRTHIPHAARRRDEIVESQRQMRDAGLDSLLLPAARSLFERTLTTADATPFDGEGTDQALAWLVRSARLPLPTPTT